MTSDEILFDSYKEAIKHTNRGMFFGVIISAIIYLAANHNIIYSGVTIPILGLNMNSKSLSMYSLSALYFYCGLYANYYYSLSLSTFSEVSDTKIKRALTFYPSLNMAGNFQSSLFAPFYLGVWYMFPKQIGIVNSQMLSMIIGTVLSFPYLMVLFNLSHERKKYLSIRKDKAETDNIEL
ncbi:hypothetical protein [Aeromonas veronii]|uniref:hypothetical protein n=1 Tax=Aeromonas veronii TaxID=654 RepID=UPI003981EA0C